MALGGKFDRQEDQRMFDVKDSKWGVECGISGVV